MTSKSARRLLVANRGEIAVRVMRSAKRLGFTTIAVFSDPDRDAPHVQAADLAVRLGPAAASDSYLSIERVIAAAQQSGATHVHPGYGFLSENADFARACVEAGLTFVGPTAEAITLMGDKGRARAAMIAAGVPCVPGYQGDDQTDARLVAEADRIGYPIMIKASSGGGGRGLRIATNRNELTTLIGLVRSEASRSFGHGSVVLERALTRVRHVEVQVFGDQQGHVIALGERDCSTQRRHQKVIEEAPSPAVTPELRRQMCGSAVQAAKSASYVGAGTVEMLLDDRGEFYFLEMNTRLQVEHPVTEAITGIDLVEWQLRVADGEPLPITQEQVTLRGHAIEVRLYAEDPVALVPQTGTIASCHVPEHIRVDHALRAGLTIAAHYDPMLAKLVAHGDTRQDARMQLIAALHELHVLGVVTNKALLLRLLEHHEFAQGEVDTSFVDRALAEPIDSAQHTLAMNRCVITTAALLHEQSARTQSPHAELRHFRNGGRIAVPLKLQLGETIHEVRVTSRGAGASATLTVDLGHVRADVSVTRMDAHRARLHCDGLAFDVAYMIEGERIELDLGEGSVELYDRTLPDAARAGGAASGEVNAPMDGVIVRVEVDENANVVVGQALLTIESMKLQHVIRAAVAGRVTFVGARAGSQTKRGSTLVRIEAA